MALQPKNETGILYNANGQLLNHVLEEHARDFTLQFLHHTICGAALDNELIDGRLVDRHEMPLVAKPSSLIITPDEREIRPYERQVPIKPGQMRYDVDAHPEDMLKRRFIHSHARLQNRGALAETIDAQRQAMILTTEHALDAVVRKDQGGFNDAQRDIDTIIGLGSQMIMPHLRDIGIAPVDRAEFIKEIHEQALTSAIQNRCAQLSESEAQALTERWQEYSRGYHDLKQKGVSNRPEMDLDQHLASKVRPYAARVRFQGRDMMQEGYAASMLERNGNDNERAR